MLNLRYTALGVVGGGEGGRGIPCVYAFPYGQVDPGDRATGKPTEETVLVE